MEKETFEFIYSEKANLQSFMKAVKMMSGLKR